MNSSRTRRALYGVVSAAMLAGAAMLPHGPASAAAAATSAGSDACLAQISVPNVSITASSPGMFLWVRGTLVRACHATDAKWNAVYNSATVGTWDFDNTTTAIWGLGYGAGPLGHYQALPAGAVDAAGNPVPQARDGFAVKFGSRIRIEAYRSGSYVYVRAHVSRFNWSLNGGYGAWLPSSRRNVDFFDWRASGWHGDGSLASGSNGWTPYLRIYAPTARNFRAHVAQTTTIWGAHSASLKR